MYGADEKKPENRIQLGFGLGLRQPHYRHVLNVRPARVDWFEVISENFMGFDGEVGGNPIAVLEKVREDYPIVLHGVSMSLGSTDPLNSKYLSDLKRLIHRIQPAMVSDHACWTGVSGENLHDLLPLPYTEEAMEHLASRIRQVQDFLGRRILIENVSSYISYAHSEMTEWEFLAEVVKAADCGILLDVNNIYVSSVNHAFDPELFLNGIPVERVGQFHIAGHTRFETHIVDTHDHPVPDPVWELYKKAITRFGSVSTLLERDDHIPPFAELQAELELARKFSEEILGTPKGKSSKFERASILDALDTH